MKVSELTINNVKEYCRISDNDEDILVSAILEASKSHIISYTGLTANEIDTHEDITIAVLVLCSDMYDNRQMTVKNGTENKIVATILAMYSNNYL